MGSRHVIVEHARPCRLYCVGTAAQPTSQGCSAVQSTRQYQVFGLCKSRMRKGGLQLSNIERLKKEIMESNTERPNKTSDLGDIDMYDTLHMHTHSLTSRRRVGTYTTLLWATHRP